MFRYERCGADDCVVTRSGIASGCGGTACPSCGGGEANLTPIPNAENPAGRGFGCTCGNRFVIGSDRIPSDELLPVRTKRSIQSQVRLA
jgi:hypothetical protein